MMIVTNVEDMMLIVLAVVEDILASTRAAVGMMKRFFVEVIGMEEVVVKSRHLVSKEARRVMVSSGSSSRSGQQFGHSGP